MLAYGPALIWSLTSYPGHARGPNPTFRPIDEGGTGQYEWLEQTLIQYKDDPRWKIVMLHVPVYTPLDSTAYEETRTYLKPLLFETYGVNIVLTGHEHFYARRTENNIPYLILGGGGAGLGSVDSDCDSNPQKCYKHYDYVAKKHHFAYFKISEDVMAVGIHDVHGILFDNFFVHKAQSLGGGSFEWDWKSETIKKLLEDELVRKSGAE